MLCKHRALCPERCNKHCGGCGTVWSNNRLVDCSTCSGTGENSKSKEPTFTFTDDWTEEEKAEFLKKWGNRDRGRLD
jgi:hypothetical protein